MNKAITLPAWDGVSRVLTGVERRAIRRAEKARWDSLTKEQQKVELDAAYIERIRSDYRINPDGASRNTLSRYPQLSAELEDYKRRNNVPDTAELRRLSGARRYAAQVRQTVKWDKEFDRFVWQELESLREARELATGVRWSIDHMLPLRARLVSGLHTAKNWQLIPSWMNFQKGIKLVLTEPDEWMIYQKEPDLLMWAESSEGFKNWIRATR